MSLLSKLLSGKKPSLSDVVDLLQGEKKKNAPEPYIAGRPNPPAYAPAEPVATGPSGFSWGPVMPNEPNQFNFPGSYLEYFRDIFNRDFPQYRVSTQENPKSSRIQICTFWQGEQKALVVELLSQKCDSYRLREDCARKQIPYLRFYYDREGWWNTRAYVIQRIQKALGQ